MQAIFNKAHKAGMEAANAVQVTPMIVVEHESPVDDNSPIKQAWKVESGVCGFAWVVIKGNTKFGRWASKKGLAGKGYPTGLNIWVRDFGQSYTRKNAYAQAFANVLQDNGITAYAQSRLD